MINNHKTMKALGLILLISIILGLCYFISSNKFVFSKKDWVNSSQDEDIQYYGDYPGEEIEGSVSLEPKVSDREATIIEETKKKSDGETSVIEESYQFINAEGRTLSSRILPPKNYIRNEISNSSFVNFIRNLNLKKDGSPVLLYDGKKKDNQSAQVAVFDFDIGVKDLQQCADSLIRVYAEYYWSIGAYEKIAFHLTNNFYMEYTKWRDGFRLSVSGNETSWVKSSTYDDSYENLRKYLDTIYIYAGTLSLDKEATKVDLNDIEVGDMFIQGGSPGHCVLVIDMVEVEQGNRAFLLAQGYMPAQDFQVLKNPLHEEDPWYYTSELSYPLYTPQWTFKEGSLKRWLK